MSSKSPWKKFAKHKTIKPATPPSTIEPNSKKLQNASMELRAEIISIGDELTSGQRLDTNSKWLSEQLGNVGVKTAFHTTVGDCMSDNIDAFRSAARRADIVISTGGLGPTADDLTREAIAIAFDAPLEIRSEALEHIESLFAVRKRPMPERNRVQALFPIGSRIIDNPHGTAPGIDLIVARSLAADAGCSRIFSLPGVPAEMIQMYRATVEPRLVQEMGVGGQRWFFHSVKVFGIGESDVEKKLPDLIRRDRDPLVGITVSKATITLRIAALCSSQTEFDAKIQPTLEQISNQLGLLIFGQGEMDLHHATQSLLKERHLTLGVIEVGAGVRIQKCLTDLSENGLDSIQAGRWFSSMASLSASIPAGFEAELIDLEGADATAVLLANAAESMRQNLDLDLCLAAGVYPAYATVVSSAKLPISKFTFAIARRDKPTKHTSVSLGAHPEVLYHRLAKAGLNFLRLELLQNG
jgi:nicotinamide-nucleotide amidase